MTQLEIIASLVLSLSAAACGWALALASLDLRRTVRVQNRLDRLWNLTAGDTGPILDGDRVRFALRQKQERTFWPPIRMGN